MTALALLVAQLAACCTGDYVATYSRPGDEPYGLEVLGLQVRISEAGIGGSYAAIPGPEPDFDGTPCPDEPQCYDVRDSFSRRGRIRVARLGETDRIALRFELLDDSDLPRRANDVWDAGFVLSPQTSSRAGGAPLPAGCAPRFWAEPPACLGEAYHVADAVLNDVYREVRDTVPRQTFAQIRARQRQWIRDRDASCGSARRATAAWAAGVAETLCLHDETVRQTAVLRRHL